MNLPAVGDLRRGIQQHVVNRIVRNADRHGTVPEMLIEIRYILGQVIDREKLRQFLKTGHGFFTGQVGVPRILRIQRAAILQDQRRRTVEVPQRQHTRRRVIEIHTSHLQGREKIFHILQRIRCFQTQLIENIRPHIQYPKIHGLRQRVDAVVDSRGHQKALLKPIRDLHKIIKLRQILDRIPNTQLERYGIVDAGSNIRRIPGGVGQDQLILVRHQRQIHLNTCLCGKILVDHLLHDLQILPGTVHPHLQMCFVRIGSRVSL